MRAEKSLVPNSLIGRLEGFRVSRYRCLIAPSAHTLRQMGMLLHVYAHTSHTIFLLESSGINHRSVLVWMTILCCLENPWLNWMISNGDLWIRLLCTLIIKYAFKPLTMQWRMVTWVHGFPLQFGHTMMLMKMLTKLAKVLTLTCFYAAKFCFLFLWHAHPIAMAVSVI